MYQINDRVEYHSAVSDETFVGTVINKTVVLGMTYAYQIRRDDGTVETIPAINVIGKVS